MAPVNTPVARALFRALLAVLGGQKQPEKAAAVSQARAPALGGPAGLRKNSKRARGTDQNRRRIRAPRPPWPITHGQVSIIHASFWCTWQKLRPY